ncbi:2Fe-2S iron-sulfur cluster binding domain-containing protein [Pseudomonas sp. USHLN015]|uniref:2Fe-2S iron-sulfur cluster binding domain-containing protein n=1 Tax=Pseudomonas sp. USHLN015 TaxID=3081296 RepID=UPI00301E5D45
MFAFLSRHRPSTVRVNDVEIRANPRETLLHAALRHGIDFPHSCRVGGCATCKCRLVAGRVRELTEASYILDDEALDQGYILACQSVPLGDLRIEVDLTRHTAMRRVRGKVVGQARLTHDITRLVVQLQEALPYKAGQYAALTLDALPGQPRLFSFATPPRPDGQVAFFIRKVPGGSFTGLVDERSLLGQGLSLEGPQGEFHLRPSAAPLLMVGGGSGLAPLLALLQGALAGNPGRPATLLFGARQEHDLYALDEIASLAAQWPAPFRFVPVLSESTPDTRWSGARGLVTEHIPALLETGAHAYLCGPPGMIDSATALLRELGLPPGALHADRFTTAPHPATVGA